MERIYVNPHYAELIQAQGYDTVRGLLRDTVEGSALELGAERNTYRLELAGQGFFLKQVRKRRLGPALESLLRLRLPHHYAWREMQQVLALQAAGLDVMEVVAAGERTRLGVPEASAILVRQVEGTALDALYLQAEPGEQQAMLVKLGALTGKLHQAGFFSPVRMKDIIVTAQGRYVLIDRETRSPRPRSFSRKRAQAGLRRFLHRQRRDYPDWQSADSLSLLEGYLQALGPGWDTTAQRLLSDIS